MYDIPGMKKNLNDTAQSKIGQAILTAYNTPERKNTLFWAVG